ncbi:hypothetical protein D3C71_1604210 [compost metagenome]
MHAGEHFADGRAVHRRGRELAAAAQAVDHGRGLAAHAQQDVAALAIGLRIGHGNAGMREVLHQVQVERQLLGREALEQRQDPLTLIGGQEVVGVLYASLDAAQALEGAQRQVAQQFARLFFGDFGKNSHGKEHAPGAAQEERRKRGVLRTCGCSTRAGRWCRSCCGCGCARLRSVGPRRRAFH